MGRDYEYRRVQLTINNPMDAGMNHEEMIRLLNTLSTRYFALVDEIGESGTYHTHVYIVFTTSCRFSTIKKRFPTAHIERAYGTSRENIDYLLKIGKWEKTKKAETTVSGSFYEQGEFPDPESEKKNLMQVVQQEIEDGLSSAEIVREHPSLNFRIKDLEQLRQTFLYEHYATQMRKIETIYVYGDTGTGKTSGIYRENYPEDVCRITNYANPRALFDSYRTQRVLVFEEFHSQIPMPDMLSYLDIYPLMLPARYSDRMACYTKVYIVSNLSLMQQYTDIQKREPRTWDAFLRRIHTVRRYSDIGCFEDIQIERGFVPI